MYITFPHSHSVQSYVHLKFLGKWVFPHSKNKVFITLAAIKLARTNDEIAFLIGHEIAHNIFHYKSFNASEADYMGINYLDKPKIREAKSLFIWTNEKKEIESIFN